MVWFIFGMFVGTLLMVYIQKKYSKNYNSTLEKLENDLDMHFDETKNLQKQIDNLQGNVRKISEELRSAISDEKIQELEQNVSALAKQSINPKNQETTDLQYKAEPKIQHQEEHRSKPQPSPEQKPWASMQKIFDIVQELRQRDTKYCTYNVNTCMFSAIKDHAAPYIVMVSGNTNVVLPNKIDIFRSSELPGGAYQCTEDIITEDMFMLRPCIVRAGKIINPGEIR